MTSSPFLQATPIRFDADRTGVVASVLCAIHCALTPVLLLFAPTFGQVWSHPASHWVVALFVVPLAIVMIRRGFQQHRKRWVVAFGALGVSLVLIGAGIPYWEGAAESSVSHEKSADASSESEDFVYVVGESEEITDSETAFTDAVCPDAVCPDAVCTDAVCTDAVCVDACCPSLVAGEDGRLKLHIPLASIVTTLGGIALIVTHLGNICCCASCRSAKEREFAVKRDPTFLTSNSFRSNKPDQRTHPSPIQ